MCDDVRVDDRAGHVSMFYCFHVVDGQMRSIRVLPIRGDKEITSSRKRRMAAVARNPAQIFTATTSWRGDSHHDATGVVGADRIGNV